MNWMDNKATSITMIIFCLILAIVLTILLTFMYRQEKFNTDITDRMDKMQKQVDTYF
jgi:uncharacterized protein YpmB